MSQTWKYKKHHSKETKEKVSKMFKGQHHSPNTEFKKGMTPWNKNRKGVYSKETLKKMSHIASQRKKESASHWEGGKYIDTDGYILIYFPIHPFARQQHRYVLEHRLVMEKFLGRFLSPIEIVHHINGIKTDNRIENLKLFSNNSAHRKTHRPWNKGLKLKR